MSRAPWHHHPRGDSGADPLGPYSEMPPTISHHQYPHPTPQSAAPYGSLGGGGSAASVSSHYQNINPAAATPLPQSTGPAYFSVRSGQAEGQLPPSSAAAYTAVHPPGRVGTQMSDQVFGTTPSLPPHSLGDIARKPLPVGHRQSQTNRRGDEDWRRDSGKNWRSNQQQQAAPAPSRFTASQRPHNPELPSYRHVSQTEKTRFPMGSGGLGGTGQYPPPNTQTFGIEMLEPQKLFEQQAQQMSQPMSQPMSQLSQPLSQPMSQPMSQQQGVLPTQQSFGYYPNVSQQRPGVLSVPHQSLDPSQSMSADASNQSLANLLNLFVAAQASSPPLPTEHSQPPPDYQDHSKPPQTIHQFLDALDQLKTQATRQHQHDSHQDSLPPVAPSFGHPHRPAPWGAQQQQQATTATGPGVHQLLPSSQFSTSLEYSHMPLHSSVVQPVQQSASFNQPQYNQSQIDIEKISRELLATLQQTHATGSAVSMPHAHAVRTPYGDPKLPAISPYSEAPTGFQQPRQPATGRESAVDNPESLEAQLKFILARLSQQGDNRNAAALSSTAEPIRHALSSSVDRSDRRPSVHHDEWDDQQRRRPGWDDRRDDRRDTRRALPTRRVNRSPDLRRDSQVSTAAGGAPGAVRGGSSVFGSAEHRLPPKQPFGSASRHNNNESASPTSFAGRFQDRSRSREMVGVRRDSRRGVDRRTVRRPRSRSPNRRPGLPIRDLRGRWDNVQAPGTNERGAPMMAELPSRGLSPRRQRGSPSPLRRRDDRSRQAEHQPFGHLPVDRLVGDKSDDYGGRQLDHREFGPGSGRWDNRSSIRDELGNRGDRRPVFDQRTLSNDQLRMKRGREPAGWIRDSQDHVVVVNGGPIKKKKGDGETYEMKHWVNGKTVKDVALSERVLPKEFVWDTDETKIDLRRDICRLWQFSSNHDVIKTATAIRTALTSLNRPAKSIDRCLSGILITRLPNVSCVALQRALSQYLKVIRVQAHRISLAIYHETGLCKGWGIIEPTKWTFISQLFFAPQFEWRGICAKLRPITCPQLIHLNSCLTLAAQYGRPTSNPDITEWGLKEFKLLSNGFTNSLIRPMANITDDTDNTPLGSSSSLAVYTTDRRICMSIPSTWPQFSALTCTLLQQRLQQKEQQQQQQMWLSAMFTGRVPSSTETQAGGAPNPRIGQVIPPPFLAAPSGIPQQPQQQQLQDAVQDPSRSATHAASVQYEVSSPEKDSLMAQPTTEPWSGAQIEVQNIEDEDGEFTAETEMTKMVVDTAMDRLQDGRDCPSVDASGVVAGNQLVDEEGDVVLSSTTVMAHYQVTPPVTIPHDTTVIDHDQDIPPVTIPTDTTVIAHDQVIPPVTIPHDTTVIDHDQVIPPDFDFVALPPSEEASTEKEDMPTMTVACTVPDIATNNNNNNEKSNGLGGDVNGGDGMDVSLSDDESGKPTVMEEGQEVETNTPGDLTNQSQSQRQESPTLQQHLPQLVSGFNNTLGAAFLASPGLNLTTSPKSSTTTQQAQQIAIHNMNRLNEAMKAASHKLDQGLPTVMINNEPVTMKPMKEEEFGFFSLFSFGSHQLLSLELLADFAYAYYVSRFLDIPASESHCWAVNLQSDGLDILHIFEQLKSLLSLSIAKSNEGDSAGLPEALTRVSAIAELPYVIHLSELPNMRDGDDQLVRELHTKLVEMTKPQVPKTKVTETKVTETKGDDNDGGDVKDGVLANGLCGRTAEALLTEGDSFANPEQSVVDSHELWGCQLFRFAETSRLRGDGLLLLPSHAKSQLLLTRALEALSSTSVAPVACAPVNLLSLERPILLRRYLSFTTHVDVDLELISTAFRVATLKLYETIQMITEEQQQQQQQQDCKDEKMGNKVNRPELEKLEESGWVDWDSLMNRIGNARAVELLNGRWETREERISEVEEQGKSGVVTEEEVSESGSGLKMVEDDGVQVPTVVPMADDENPTDASMTLNMTSDKTTADNHQQRSSDASSTKTDTIHPLLPVHLMPVCNHSVISIEHLVETFFFSPEVFFNLIGGVELRRTVQERPEEETVVLITEQPTLIRVIVTPDMQKSLSSLANHVLPNLCAPKSDRAYSVLKELGELLGLTHELIDPDTSLPTNTSLVLEGPAKDSSLVLRSIDILNRYVEVTQWLMLEAEPDWQATLRVPAIICEVDPSAMMMTVSPTTTTTTTPFELTGDVCNTACEAKLNCAIKFIRVMAEIENRMMEKLGVKLSDLPNIEFQKPKDNLPESSSAAADMKSVKPYKQPHRPHLPPIVSQWEKPTTLMSGDTDMSTTTTSTSLSFSVKVRLSRDFVGLTELESHIEKMFTPQSLKELEDKSQFRFVPLEFFIDTPKHKYEIEKRVQKLFRKHEKESKAAAHDMLFQPVDEDSVLAELQMEGFPVTTKNQSE